ncbi:MAG: PAS domain-containing protein [candidate division KSB1 bacterium]|nr:PAS domain-containing protein [candidate division KSB1 bacterium]
MLRKLLSGWKQRKVFGAFGRALSAAPIGIMILNERGRVTYLNPAGRRILGLGDTEAEGKNLADVVSDPEFDGLRRTLEPILSGAQRSLQATAFSLPVDGKRKWISIRAVPSNEPEHATYILFHPLVGADPFLRQYCVELAERFIHDVKNHLTGLELGLNQLLRRIEPVAGSDDRIHDALERVQRRVKLLDDLAWRYRKLIRPELCSMDNLELISFVSEWARGEQEWLPRDVTLQTVSEYGRKLWVRGDAHMVHVCLDVSLRLLLDSMLGGGRVLVSIGKDQAGAVTGVSEPPWGYVRMRRVAEPPGERLAALARNGPLSQASGENLLLAVLHRAAEVMQGRLQTVAAAQVLEEITLSLPAGSGTA